MMCQISRCLLQLCNYTGLISGNLLYRSSEMTSARSIGLSKKKKKKYTSVWSIGLSKWLVLESTLAGPWSLRKKTFHGPFVVLWQTIQLTSEQCTFTFYTSASNIYKHVPPQSAIRYALSKTCRRNNFTHAHRQVASNFRQPNNLRCDTSSSIGDTVLLTMHHKHRPLLV